MLRKWWQRPIRRWLSGPSGRTTERVEPARPLPRVRLSLEELEPRVVLSATAIAPPSFQQAAFSLYLDGIQLALSNVSAAAQAETFLSGKPDYSPTLLAQAQFFGYPNPSQLQANIAFNTPYAQPFSTFLVLAGASAEFNLLASSNSIPTNQAASANPNNSL